MDKKKGTLILISILFIIGLLIYGRIVQNNSYHKFADERAIFSIPNFADVVSNLFFIVVGILGINFCLKKSSCVTIIDFSLFIGFILTGFGSAYYHYAPTSSTLIWDRLPMTFVFMSYLSLLVKHHVHKTKSLLFFYFLISLGAFSILYWHLSASMGMEDLRPYVFVQFGPILIIPFIFKLYKASQHGLSYVYLTFIFYILAKVFEATDRFVFNILNISGHTLKHVFAAIACYYILKYVIYIKLHESNRSKH